MCKSSLERLRNPHVATQFMGWNWFVSPFLRGQTHQSEKKRVSWGSVAQFPWRRREVKLWLSLGGILAWKVCVRKDAINGGLHFCFQMCGLSCCLSLRWSLSTFFRVFTSLFMQLFRITSVLTHHSPNPQKHYKGKPNITLAKPNNWPRKGRFQISNHTSDLNLFFNRCNNFGVLTLVYLSRPTVELILSMWFQSCRILTWVSNCIKEHKETGLNTEYESYDRMSFQWCVICLEASGGT